MNEGKRCQAKRSSAAPGAREKREREAGKLGEASLGGDRFEGVVAGYEWSSGLGYEWSPRGVEGAFTPQARFARLNEDEVRRAMKGTGPGTGPDQSLSWFPCASRRTVVADACPNRVKREGDLCSSCSDQERRFAEFTFGSGPVNQQILKNEVQTTSEEEKVANLRARIYEDNNPEEN